MKKILLILIFFSINIYCQSRPTSKSCRDKVNEFRDIHPQIRSWLITHIKPNGNLFVNLVFNNLGAYFHNWEGEKIISVLEDEFNKNFENACKNHDTKYFTTGYDKNRADMEIRSDIEKMGGPYHAMVYYYSLKNTNFIDIYEKYQEKNIEYCDSVNYNDIICRMSRK